MFFQGTGRGRKRLSYGASLRVKHTVVKRTVGKAYWYVIGFTEVFYLEVEPPTWLLDGLHKTST